MLLACKGFNRKDNYDLATVHYSTEDMLNETKKGPLFEPKFIFIKLIIGN
jgi:hypothetical protein